MMKRSLVLLAAVLLSCRVACGETPLNPALQKYFAERVAEFDTISSERRNELDKIAAYVRMQIAAGKPARLTFICTHNSRRSHFAQVWAATAAAHFGVQPVETFSGGTEATAFNPRAVSALRRAGFEIASPKPGVNPHYHVRIGSESPALECFSKVYNADPNPAADFAAVMTCSQADEACPVVKGAAQRISLPFDDPKGFDDTPQETEKYDARCRQIARELLYAFSRVQR
jgi:protein-tyrosine-phosphatase